MTETGHPPLGRTESYSNLEVAQSPKTETWKCRAPDSDHSSPQALDPNALPEVIYGGAKSTSTNPHGYAVDSDKETVPPRRKRRLFIIIGVVVAILVIIGAVAGGVLGSRHSKSSAAQEPAPTQGASKDGGSQDNTDNQTGGNDTLVLESSALAAINWTSGDANGAHYRAVFWQTITDDLMASVWISSTDQWTVVNLTHDVSKDGRDKEYVRPKAGTPLSATIKLTPWPKFKQISLFYLAADTNAVTQIGTGSIEAKTDWRSGELSTLAPKDRHIAGSDSRITSFNVACAEETGNCDDSEIYVFYQDSNNAIRKLHQGNWTNNLKLTGNELQKGTGLAQAYTGSPYSTDKKVFTPYLYMQSKTELQAKMWYPVSGRRPKIEGATTANDGSAPVLSAAVIPAAGDTLVPSNDILLLSLAVDGSRLILNRYSNSTGDWTGSKPPKLDKAPSSFNFTQGAIIASPDEPRFFGLESNGTIRSFKIDQKDSWQWEYEGLVPLE